MVIETFLILVSKYKTLIEISGTIITAFSAVVTTMIAIILFLSNRKSPLIDCLMKDDESLANLIITNSGNSVAKNIKFKVTGSLAKQLEIDISTLNFVALAPGETYTYCVGQWFKFEDCGDLNDLKITSYYNGLFNRFFRKTSTYTFSLKSVFQSSNITNWNRQNFNKMKGIEGCMKDLVRLYKGHIDYIRQENQKKPYQSFSQRIESRRTNRQK